MIEEKSCLGEFWEDRGTTMGLDSEIGSIGYRAGFEN